MANEEVTLTPGTPEYEAAMAAKAKEGGVSIVDHDVEQEAEGSKPTRPADVPEKFWDAEKGEVNVQALVKSYTELEKAHGKSPKEPTAEEKAAAEAAAKAAEAAAGDAGGDALRAKAEQEWLANEALSEETYKAYEKVGVTREQIATYIEGQKALAEVRQNEAYAAVGGEEKYKAMQAWAAANLTQAEKEAYDRDVLGSSDKVVRTNAIRGLAARFAQAEGSDGQMVVPGNETPAANEGFKSKAEMVAAMRDPKYKTSAEFRAEVAQKIAAAVKAGVYLGMS